MEGRARAAKREAEAMLSHAWHIEAFARQKRLPNLAKLLNPKRRKKAQSPDEMFAVLMQCQAGGAPLIIKTVH